MPSLASGLQRCSPCERLWDYYGRFPVGFPLHVCSLCNKGNTRMELKRLTIQDIPATLLDANTGFAGCSHLPLRGQMTTVATKQRANCSEITPGSLRSRPTMLPCSAAPCSEDIVGESWVSSVSAGQTALPLSSLSDSVICLVQEARTCWQQTCKAHSKLFLDDGICPDHTARAPGCTSDAFLPDYFQRSGSLLPNSERHRSMQRRRLGEHGSCQRSAGLLTACIGSRCFKNLLPNFWDCRVYRSLV